MVRKDSSVLCCQTEFLQVSSGCSLFFSEKSCFYYFFVLSKRKQLCEQKSSWIFRKAAVGIRHVSAGQESAEKAISVCMRLHVGYIRGWPMVGFIQKYKFLAIGKNTAEAKVPKIWNVH